MTHLQEVYKLIEAVVLANKAALGITVDSDVVFGDLSWLPEPATLTDRTLVLIAPEDGSATSLDSNGESEIQTYNWRIYLVRPFVEASPFSAIVGTANLLYMKLRRAERAMTYADFKEAGVTVAQVASIHFQVPAYQPPESELLRRDPRFWMEITMAAIQFKSEVRVDINPGS